MVKTAIITGSTKGIGLGIAQELYRLGMNVVITSRRQEDAEKTAKALSSDGLSKAIGIEFDIEKKECFDHLIQSTLKAFGRIDLLVNNALSQATVPPPEALTDEQIDNAFIFGISNIFILSRRVMPELKKTQGSIINISSVAVDRHIDGMPIYGIVKAAINQMTKVLAAEWAKHKIRVNAISPGFIYSEALPSIGMPEELVKRYYEHLLQFHPLGRIGNPQDIGKLVAFLASDQASFITGSIIRSDAGYCVQGINMHPQ